MDLLRLTLARLPLQRLVGLHASESSVPEAERVISTRLLTLRIETVPSSRRESLTPHEDEFKKFDEENKSCESCGLPDSHAAGELEAAQNYLHTMLHQAGAGMGAIIQQIQMAGGNVIAGLQVQQAPAGIQLPAILLNPLQPFVLPPPQFLINLFSRQPKAVDPRSDKLSVLTTDYLRMLTLAGELTTESQLYVRIDALLERALFLRDADAFYYYAGICPFHVHSDEFAKQSQMLTNHLFIQKVLDVGDPKITAIALALAVNTGRLDDLFPVDWKSIKWTPGLRWYYESICRTFFTQARVQRGEFISTAASIAGYLQIWPLEDTPRHLPFRLRSYLRYYISSYFEVERSKPGFDRRSILKILEGTSKEIWGMQGLYILQSGTIFSSENPIPLVGALEEILPEVVQELLAAGMTIPSHDIPPMQFHRFITRTVAENAHRMLVVLTPDVALATGIPIGYLMYLRAICGLSIGKEELLGLLDDQTEFNHNCLPAIAGAMIGTMHPDMFEDQLFDMAYDIPSSTVHHDPEHFVKVYKDPIGNNIITAYRYGLGWLCQGAADCRISSAHARRGPVGKFANPSEIRSVEEILSIEAITGDPLPNRERLLENARAFKEHVQIFYELLSR